MHKESFILLHRDAPRHSATSILASPEHIQELTHPPKIRSDVFSMNSCFTRGPREDGHSFCKDGDLLFRLCTALIEPAKLLGVGLQIPLARE